MPSIPRGRSCNGLLGTSVNAAESNALTQNGGFVCGFQRPWRPYSRWQRAAPRLQALADNPVGFYVGAGAGESQIRSDDSRYGYPGYYNDYQTAWQAIGGIRPIRLIGLGSAVYIDFGQPYRHHHL